jgi:hypothetical protein
MKCAQRCGALGRNAQAMEAAVEATLPTNPGRNHCNQEMKRCQEDKLGAEAGVSDSNKGLEGRDAGQVSATGVPDESEFTDRDRFCFHAVHPVEMCAEFDEFVGAIRVSANKSSVRPSSGRGRGCAVAENGTSDTTVELLRVSDKLGLEIDAAYALGDTSDALVVDATL